MALPAGPGLLPPLQTLRWVRDPYPFLDECRAAYGGTFTLRLAGFGESVFTDDPATIHEVFTASPDILQAGKGNDVLLPFVGAHSLLVLDGAPHARDRKLMTPPFHGARMRAYGATIGVAAERVTEAWRPGETVATHPAMQSASLEVILRAVMGLDDGPQLERGRATVTELLDTVGGALFFFGFLRHDLGRWSPWGRFLARRKLADAMWEEAVRERRAHPGEDILSLLLSARDEAGEPMSDAAIHDELVTLLLAGHETTANALAWALAWLVASPEVLERLTAEVDEANDDPDTLGKLPYLGAVCNEALRILPVFPIVMRVAAREWQGSTLTLPAGARIAPCIYLVHRRPDLYPEPDRFRPERFLDRTFSPSEFIPFGGGARRCIGAAFALYEMRIILATVLRRFRIGPVDGAPVAVRRNLAIGPRHGARVRILARR